MREITKYHDTSKTVKERAKNKLFGAVYSHTAIILLLILLQIGIMVLTFTYLGNYSTYMNGVMSLLSFITAIYIFNEKGNPAFKMTWILFVFLVPVVGVGFYLFTKAGIGTKYLGARLEKLRVETEPYMQQNEYVVHAMKGGRVANANLSHFLYNDLNMSKIESRPIEGRSWEYRFFVDFEGNLEEPGVKNALRGLREESRSLKILGNY